MRKLLTILGIYLVSELVGLVISPPDPMSHWLYTLVILLVAIPSYLLGLYENKDKKTTTEKAEC
jgi:Sec-independent protein secretion pathway component TatC